MIYQTPSGVLFYLANRRRAEIYRFGEPTISAAIRAEKAAWAIDEDTIIKMRTKKVAFVGVMVRESEDIYLAPLSAFLDKTKAKVLNYEGRGGALQRYLPFAYFQYRPGRAKLT